MEDFKEGDPVIYRSDKVSYGLHFVIGVTSGGRVVVWSNDPLTGHKVYKDVDPDELSKLPELRVLSDEDIDRMRIHSYSFDFDSLDGLVD